MKASWPKYACEHNVDGVQGGRNTHACMSLVKRARVDMLHLLQPLPFQTPFHRALQPGSPFIDLNLDSLTQPCLCWQLPLQSASSFTFLVHLVMLVCFKYRQTGDACSKSSP